MFDRPTFILNETSSSTHTTVTEKRAPTDESVRLMMEMEAAVEKKFLGQFKTDPNTLDATVVVFSDYMNWETVYVILYKINGIPRKFRAAVNMRTSEEECVTQLRTKFAAELAIDLLSTAFKDHRGPINPSNGMK